MTLFREKDFHAGESHPGEMVFFGGTVPICHPVWTTPFLQLPPVALETLESTLSLGSRVCVSQGEIQVLT